MGHLLSQCSTTNSTHTSLKLKATTRSYKLVNNHLCHATVFVVYNIHMHNITQIYLYVQYFTVVTQIILKLREKIKCAD